MHLLSAVELNEKFLKKELSAVEITKTFLDRIEKHDSQINAYLSVFPEKALKKAEELDKKRERGDKLGLMAAVPVAVKDNILVKDEITTCGSKFLSNFKAPFQATAVSLLENEDAVVIGKTNCDEFGMGSSNENSAYKKVYNPWNLKLSPGGSSGGSAAAVAARMSPISLGSDTGGSVRQPASFCGLIGYKPTYGRVSRYGLVAFGSSLDTIGTFAGTVKDAARVMEIIGRHCDKDSTSLNLPPETITLSTQIKGKKIGVPWEFLEGLNPETKQTFLNSLEIMKRMGAEIIDVDLSILKYSLPVYYIVACAEASTNLARFDGIRYGIRSARAKTLDEVYDFSRQEGFGPEVKRRIMLGTYVLSKGYQDAYYKKAQKVRTLILQKYIEAFKKCDIIATPTSPSAAFELGSVKEPVQMYLEDIYTIAINLAGLPAVSVPMGLNSNGLPLGLQLIGPQKGDAEVLNLAHAYEVESGFTKNYPDLARAS
jgi:aspartyl-tRNA(Asn)/glutamyl-tRNA(Gln) amidotransferase subunit A